MHLFFGTPVKDACAPEMVECLERACAVLRAERFTLTRRLEPRGGVVVARNLLASHFLASGADGLFFVDSDVCGFTPDDVLRIVRSGEDVVGGPVPGRSFEPDRLARAIAHGVPVDDHLFEHAAPLLFWKKEGGGARTRGNHLLEVEAMGTGFLYVSRRALEAVAAKLPTVFLGDERIRNLFDFVVTTGGQLVGEDLAFSRRWQTEGGTVWADTRTTLMHVGRMHFRAPALAGRLVARAAGEESSAARAPDDRPTRAKSAVDLTAFECPAVLLGDALAVAGGEYELPGVRFASPPVVLDVGANVGAFARWARARWPGAKIHCYEPHPEIAPILERNVAADVQTITRAAVAAERGRLPLYEGAVNACQSSIYPDVAAAQCTSRSHVVDVLDAGELPPADVLKLDAEGAELAILTRYLQTHREWPNAPQIVMLEFHRRGDRRALEDVCAAHGLALVQATVRAQDSGLLWFVRERAIATDRPPL